MNDLLFHPSLIHLVTVVTNIVWVDANPDLGPLSTQRSPTSLVYLSSLLEVESLSSVASLRRPYFAPGTRLVH